ILRNSGSTPIPSGSMRISSSSPPGRSVGLMHPTTPRQLVNAMGVLLSVPRLSYRRASALAAPFAFRVKPRDNLTGGNGSLVKPDGLYARRQREPIHALRRIARRAGGHVVDQDGTDLAALGVDREGSHNGSHAADRPHLDDHAALHDVVEVELHLVELEAIDGLAGLALDQEGEEAAIVGGLYGVELEA